MNYSLMYHCDRLTEGGEFQPITYEEIMLNTKEVKDPQP